MSEAQKPSVGRIVHVFLRDRKGTPLGIGPYPAIVFSVDKDGTTIDAEVFPTRNVGYYCDIPFSDKDGNERRNEWWDWPERV